MIELIFAFMGFLLSFFQYRLFLYLINSKFEPKYSSKLITPITLFIFFIADVFMSFITPYLPASSVNILLIIVFALILFAYAKLFRVGTTSHMLFWVFICMAFLGIGHTLAGVYSVLVFPDIPSMSLPEWAMLQISIVLVLVQSIGTYLLSHKRNTHVKMSSTVMVILIVIPILSCLLLAFLSASISSDFSNNNGISSVLFYASLVIALINLAVFVLYERMTSLTKQTLLQQTLLQRTQLEQVHYDELQSLYRETRVWRHDYRNHLQVIKGYADTGKYDLLHSYLGEIDKSLDKIDFRINSGNDLLDAIVNTKISQAEAHNIRFDVHVVVSNNTEIDPVDITTLIGNLLDNAIEACQRINIPNIEKYIELNISQISDEMIIHIENATNGAVKQ